MRKSAQYVHNKVLVSGGAGYIGSVLIKKLLKHKYAVSVLDIAPLAKDLEYLPKKIEFVLGSIQNISSDIFKNVSSVIHLAGISSESEAAKNPRLTQKLNTKAAILFARKAKGAGVKRFIFASSSSVYNQGMDRQNKAKYETDEVFPKGNYSISKYNAEKKLLSLSDSNFTVVILRKATVGGYSPKMRYDLVVNAMVKSVLEKGYIKIFCKGLQWRPLISVNDVAQAYYKALTAPKEKVAGQICNIGYDNFMIKDIALLVQKTIKKHFSKNSEIIFEHNDRKDLSYKMTTLKAKRVLRFIPKTTVEQIVIDLVSNLKQK